MGTSLAVPAEAVMVGGLPKSRVVLGNSPAKQIGNTLAYPVGPDGRSGGTGIPLLHRNLLMHSGGKEVLPNRKARMASKGRVPSEAFKIHPPMAELRIAKEENPPETGIDRSQINLDELLKLAKVILDRDSPHGSGGTHWAEKTLRGKIRKLENRYDRSLLAGGVETATSLALKAQIGFLNAAYSVLLERVAKLKPMQDKYASSMKGIMEKWAKKQKVPDFIDSVIAKYVAPGMGVLGGAAAKLSKIWDGAMDSLRLWLSPQKQWIATGIEIAAPLIAAAADVGMVYLARKWLIGLAVSRKAEMEVKKQSELAELDGERRFVLRMEYDSAKREILALLSRQSPPN